MKNKLVVQLTAFALIIICIVACNNAGPIKFKLNGSFENRKEGKMILTYNSVLLGHQVSDTVPIINGKFVFTGDIPEPIISHIKIDGNKSGVYMHIENAEMTLKCASDTLSKAKITGSPINDDIERYYLERKKIMNEFYKKNNFDSLQKIYKQKGDVEIKKLLDELKSKASLESEKINLDFVKQNPASYYSIELVQKLSVGKSSEQIENLLKLLDPKFNDSQSVKDLRAKAEAQKSFGIGMIVPDFTMNDPQGNPIKFSEVYAKNKYTLLDFWASWCGPCRKENPNVVAVFNSYKDKGFGVFGVSLDKDLKSWKKAIEKDQLNWPHVSDLKYWKNEVALLYSVSSVPFNFLIDSNGKIIDRNLREAKLREKISELLE